LSVDHGTASPRRRDAPKIIPKPQRLTETIQRFLAIARNPVSAIVILNSIVCRRCWSWLGLLWRAAC
jgi:hypothetical protein